MARMGYLKIAILLGCLIVIAIVLITANEQSDETWSFYRGDQSNTAYSGLEQITRAKVDKLEVAWEYHCGDAAEGKRSTIQCNPIIANGMMYVTSPKLKLIALDPVTGEEIWKFDPFDGVQAFGVNRGVTYLETSSDKRIFLTAGSFLYAVNAENGRIIETFGEKGRVDLRKGLGRDPEKLAVSATSPGIIYKDVIIQGSHVNESYNSAPGFIRAYDVITGKVAWTFHTIPQPGEFGYDTWPDGAYQRSGGANSWAGMSLDEKRGIVYIPTGSAAFDFYGANRIGKNLFANCLLALDAVTGKLIWHYQLVHHDLWDYDLPSPPNLVTLRHKGNMVDAVAQVTKMGMVFIFNRETGEPLFPIEERPVPSSDLPGEQAWPTQPFPVKPLPFVRQHFSEADVTDLSTESHQFVLDKIKEARTGSIYIPPSTQGVVQFPGTRGGAEWGGAAVDPEHGIMYVNANEIPMLVKMRKIEVPRKEASLAEAGERIYTLNNCTTCHGADRSGLNAFPSLRNLSVRRSELEVISTLKQGKGQMPSFPNLSDDDLKALVAFLFDKEDVEGKRTSAFEEGEEENYRFIHNGYRILTDQSGYPGVKPPWGTLNAIDLNEGELLWQVPLGEYPELIKKGLPPTGTQNLGGPAVTAGGLIFIAATRDEKFRAFDTDTGRILWEHKLPAGGYATPSVYMVDGKQYIVIAAGGGGRVGSKSGDSYVAFTLKE